MAHEGDHDAAHKDGKVPPYCRPIQRQRWGEAQILPHANWGDTFFDLFYVAGAYNLGTLLRAEPTSRGVLYFAGCFFPMLTIWSQKMWYDSRFWIPDDSFHRMYEFAVLIVLATAVLHIRPVAILSDPKTNLDMFCLSISLATASALGLGRLLELYYIGVGQPALKNAARRDLIWFSFITSWYIAASFVSGLEYFGNNDKSTAAYPKEDEYGYEDINSTTYDDDHHRFLAESGSDYSTVYENNIPIYLVLAGSMSYTFGMLVTVMTLPGGGRHKEISVPMNVGFSIHRWGEVTMVFLGEGILSLLIVDVTESSEYYKTFFSGIISITLLEYLHFRSQPHDPDDHALRRTKEAACLWTTLMQVYCAALVVLGTAYKMLVYEYVYEAKETGSYRLLSNPFSRFLAGSDEPMFALEERRQRTAHLFCASMAIVWLCSDLMIITHRGLKDNLGRCRFSHAGFLKVVSSMLVLFRIGMICFIATLSQYVTQPSVLAFVGLVGILGQVLLRVIGSSYFGPEFQHEKDHEDESSLWPNVTKPQVERED